MAEQDTTQSDDRIRKLDKPVTIEAVKHVGDASRPIKPSWRSIRTGAFVSVRPCGDEYENKTFLGIYVGEATVTGPSIKFDGQTLVIDHDAGMRNPAILIPERGAIVYGYESWWGVLKSPDDLKRITDAAIDNVWYVQAMKALTDGPGTQDGENG